MESIKDGAQALRMGLIGGYVSIAEVVAWADARISEDHGRVVPQLFDLALLRSADLGRAVSLLGEVPGVADRCVVGRVVARLVHWGLLNGRLTERDDGVDLALQGVYGNLADLRAEMLAYLSRASLPNAPA